MSDNDDSIITLYLKLPSLKRETHYVETNNVIKILFIRQLMHW